MTGNDKCIFCQKEVLATRLPDSTPCRREIYEDGCCFAVLAPEQYTTGHTLLILREHRIDITDDIAREHLSALISAIHKVSKRLKELAENDRKERPERIYVGILCDGVQHLHAHLIPRYPFNEKDKDIYKAKFSKRDEEKDVNEALQSGKLGGFWYMAEREVNWKGSEFGLRPSAERAIILEELANRLRIV